MEDNIHPDFDPDLLETDQSTDEEAPEEEAHGVQAQEEEAPEATFQSKGGNLLSYSSSQDRGGRARVENIVRMTPEPTRYVISCVDDIKSTTSTNTKMIFCSSVFLGIVSRTFASIRIHLK